MGIPARVSIIWDYDTALGQVNSTYPYNFREEVLLREISNVEFILETAASLNVEMTFACVGFAAEPGHWPYHVPDQILRIHERGHEIASHSWRHEWLPYLEKEQLTRTLRRSKLALETCVGKQGCVSGFVPPFNRPMTWKRRMAFSLGDRAWGRQFPGSDLGGLLTAIEAEGYRWCRVVYLPLWNRLLRRGTRQKMTSFRQVVCVPNQYCGFDGPAIDLLAHAAASGESLFISAHPAALSREGLESKANFLSFMKVLSEYQNRGLLVACSVHRHLEGKH